MFPIDAEHHPRTQRRRPPGVNRVDLVICTTNPVPEAPMSRTLVLHDGFIAGDRRDRLIIEVELYVIGVAPWNRRK